MPERAAPPQDDAARPLRVAMLVDVFPRPSNGFVVEQIAGLLSRGHEVDIFARFLASPPGRHPDLARWRMAERMRHLEVPDGSAARAVGLVRALLDPRVWTPQLPRELTERVRRDRSLATLYTSLSFLRAPHYDVVHCAFGTLGPLAASLRGTGALRGELALSFRGSDATQWLSRDPGRFREAFSAARLVLPVSASLAQRLEASGCPRDRIVVHHDGIDVRAAPFRLRTAPADRPPRTLFVGRLTEKKGVAYALDAFAEVRRRHADAQLHIVGDGELRAELEARAAGLELGTSVRFLGLLSPADVAASMTAADLLVAPSVTAANGDQEGIPTVLKEAMAQGMPVLSTRHSGIPELVHDGESGVLVGERDAAALARAWSTLLDDPGRWPAMGHAGRAMVEREFDAELLGDRLVELYRGAVAAAASTR